MANGLTFQTDGSGNSAADSTDSSSGNDMLSNLLDNAGDILTGSASVINALNGKPNVVVANASGSAGGGSTAPINGNKLITYAIIAIVALVALLFISKLFK